MIITLVSKILHSIVDWFRDMWHMVVTHWMMYGIRWAGAKLDQRRPSHPITSKTAEVHASPRNHHNFQCTASHPWTTRYNQRCNCLIYHPTHTLLSRRFSWENVLAETANTMMNVKQTLVVGVYPYKEGGSGRSAYTKKRPHLVNSSFHP